MTFSPRKEDGCGCAAAGRGNGLLACLLLLGFLLLRRSVNLG